MENNGNLSGPERQAEMDFFYTTLSPDKIPWNIESPPQALIELVTTGKVKPCKTLDLGCGAGNYAIYLAGLGFDVTAVDISPAAIGLAREMAKKKGTTIDFRVADLLGDPTDLNGLYGFIFEWDVLHHIYPEQRRRYVTNISRFLQVNGLYLSVCFHEDDPLFGGIGKLRTTTIGTRLYFSSQKELKKLFEPFFRIVEMKTMEVEGKTPGFHVVNYLLMTTR